MDKTPNRREFVKYITIGAVTLALPAQWIKPVIESVIVPAHAQASPPATTTTAATTTAATTAATTTTTTTTTTLPTTTIAS